MSQLLIPLVISNVHVIKFLVSNNLHDNLSIEQFFLDNMSTAILPQQFIPVSDNAFDSLKLSLPHEKLADFNFQDNFKMDEKEMTLAAPKIISTAELSGMEKEEEIDFDKRMDDAFDDAFNDTEQVGYKELLLDFLKECTIITDHNRHFIQAKMIRRNFKKWLSDKKITVKTPSDKELFVGSIPFFKTMKMLKNADYNLDESDYNALANYEKTPFPPGSKILEMKVISGFSGCIFKEPFFSVDVSSRKRQKREE